MAILENKFLYHVSSWDKLKSVTPGQVITLKPGKQGAEGKGVYFSEKFPRLTAAESANLKGVSGIIVIKKPKTARGWYRTKTSVIKKHNRPRTWHTKGKSITLLVLKRKGLLIYCKVLKMHEES